PVAQPALSTPSRPRLAPHSFPTRRSSDLGLPRRAGARKAEAGPPDLVLPDGGRGRRGGGRVHGPPGPRPLPRLLGAEPGARGRPDRKSTRLNSSHEWISYAVFCLKKKIDH